ncbi:MAG: DUF2062 domain-containing protein [Chitinispirillaceae bacterium]|nr:DUF2062 domain-containing protein [Chitinispirillaceae bacterium]
MHSNPVIVIPTYNNERTIVEVVRGTISIGIPVVVVNDGSTDATGGLLGEMEAITLLSFSENRGKGAALRTAFEWCLEHRYTHAITMDGDGQHLAEDIPIFLDKITEDPRALWIGDRLLPVDGSIAQPSRSRFGRRFGAFWYRFYTGLSIRDTQCGFRVYPLVTFATTGCRRDRFEYEIEALILAAWRGIPVKSVPIHLLYQAPEERVSHFRPVRDFLRISKVNSRAAITRIFFPSQLLDAPGLSLREKVVALVKHELRAHTSPRKAAFSLSLGVFMAVFPIHGFQVISLIALTYLLRLNRPLALVGVSVSSAPLIPFWIAAGIGVGNLLIPVSVAVPLATALESKLPVFMHSWLRNLPVAGVFEGVIRWFLGSIVLAVIAGVVTYGISFPLITKVRGRKRKKHPPKQEPPSVHS